MQIEELKTIIANTKDGMHKRDLIRQLKRLYRFGGVLTDATILGGF